MLKNILKLESAQRLSKKEQKAINGGSGIGVDCKSLDACLQSCSGECEVRAPYVDLTIPTIGEQCYVCVDYGDDHL